MANMRFVQLTALASASTLVLSSVGATLQEDFSANPALSGWRVFGNTNLFAWDQTNQSLRVTWDSSQTNSYFHHALGTILTKEDDFELEFDLRILDIATNTKSGPFQIAISLLNIAQATSTNLERGTGVDAVHGPRDIVEFDYFPAGYYAGFGDVAPSISPTIVSSENVFASGFDLLELTTNDLYHIVLTYSASNQILHTEITSNSLPFGPVADVSLGTNFSDFRVDTFAISSYSDFGDDYDSVLAHGVIDNVLVTLPPPPVDRISISLGSNSWLVGFSTQTNWLYTLERTKDLQVWTAVSSSILGTGKDLILQDTNPPQPMAFYRVGAQKP